MSPSRRAISVLSVLAMVAVLPLAARSQTAPERYSILIDGYEVAVVDQEAGIEGAVDVGAHRFLGDFLAGRDSLVTEVGFPALDNRARHMSKISLEFFPDVRTHKAPTASPRTAAPAPIGALSFRLTAPGLDGAAVTAVDAFTVKRTRLSAGMSKTIKGESIRDKHPPEIDVLGRARAGVEISDVVLRIEEADAAP